MRTEFKHSPFRLVEYDAFRHRVWILGQRCHHGATGSVVAALACARLAIARSKAASVALAVTGTALMAHDWADHSFWFEPGRGTQP
jgi:RNase P/RNase MRP subunit POP5